MLIYHETHHNTFTTRLQRSTPPRAECIYNLEVYGSLQIKSRQIPRISDFSHMTIFVELERRSNYDINLTFDLMLIEIVLRLQFTGIPN